MILWYLLFLIERYRESARRLREHPPRLIPWRIPGLQGLTILQLGIRSTVDFFEDDMVAYSAALSFHMLLALFPFIIFLIALLGFLDVPDFFNWLLTQGQSTLPQQVFERVEPLVSNVRKQAHPGLLSFGIIAAIWSASTGVRSIMHAINVAYDVEESRPLWLRYPLSVVYTLAVAFIITVAVASLLTGHQAIAWAEEQFGVQGFSTLVWTWLRWPVGLFLLIFAVSFLYYVVPNVDQRFRPITPGGVFTVSGWIAASLAFSYYTDVLANYNATYGAIGSIIALLVFFFILSFVLLFGAEIDSEIHKEALRKRGERVLSENVEELHLESR